MHITANKLRQNVGLETWLWRQIATLQTTYTKYKCTPYATEWNALPWKVSAYVTVTETKMAGKVDVVSVA